MNATRRRWVMVVLGLALATTDTAVAPSGAAPVATTRIERTARVRVALDATVTLERLLEGGFDIVTVRAGRWAELLAWPGDAARLAAIGARTTVVEADVEGAAAARAARERPSTSARTGAPAGFPPVGEGSLGGYWTLEEVKAKLDALVAIDPNEVVADRLDTLGWTHQGRPIWGLRLRAEAGPPGPRPVAFFNALTHAREPAGMQALLWFVDDLLARYPADPWARMLLEQREVYVVPVVNPDGYALNQQLFPGGGGLHRKNLRDNDSDAEPDYGSDGVDVNRNFSFQWGLDNVGSSPISTSQTYRGPFAASEPETEAQAAIVAALRPRTGLSFHSHGDLLLYPWGWTSASVGDSAAFQEWSDLITLGNGYGSGPSPRVLYRVNGEFNDWCYGETSAKPRAFTWTPEVGNPVDAFWPVPSRIVPLCEENLRSCWIVASIAGAWVRVESATLDPPHLPAGHPRTLRLRLRNHGLEGTNDEVVATLTALDDGVVVAPGSSTVDYSDVPARSSVDPPGGAGFTIAADDTVTPGRRLRLLAEFTTENGLYSRDTVEVIAGVPTVVLDDPAETVAAWNVSGGFSVVSDDPAHPSRYFADSPGGAYSPGSIATLELASPLDLSAGVHAWLDLEMRWMIETDWDAAVIEASLDGATWQPLSGRATTPGIDLQDGAQPADAPIYEGTRWRWASERLDLSELSGPAASTVWLRARMSTDGSIQLDGIALDSLRVTVYDPTAQPQPLSVAADTAPALSLAPAVPHPARERARLSFALPRSGPARLELFDVGGRRVRTVVDRDLPAGSYQATWDLTDAAGRRVPPGLYLARLVAGTELATRRIAVVR